jgi:hypothetical protein
MLACMRETPGLSTTMSFIGARPIKVTPLERLIALSPVVLPSTIRIAPAVTAMTTLLPHWSE